MTSRAARQATLLTAPPMQTGDMPRKRQTGVTYLWVLFGIAVLGVGLAVTGNLWSGIQRREKEAELMFVGSQFRDAIAHYYEKSPGGMKRFPPTLHELISDSRHPSIQRYLRKIYRDPITNSLDWGIVEAPQGGIMGVYSRSELEPLKTRGFNAEDQEFEGKMKYSDWKFLYWPPNSEGNSTSTARLVHPDTQAHLTHRP